MKKISDLDDVVLFFKGDRLVTGIVKKVREEHVIVRHARSNYSVFHRDIYNNKGQAITQKLSQKENEESK